VQAPNKLPATWLAAGNQWQCRTSGKWGKSDGSFHWGQLPDLEVGGRDAAAVVRDLEPLLAVGLEADLDGGGAGVEAVLDELLDGGGEVEDDLAGADAVHYRLAYGLDRRRGVGAPASSPSSSHSSLNPTPGGGEEGGYRLRLPLEPALLARQPGKRLIRRLQARVGAKAFMWAWPS
jgi:hypothetical protein